MVSIARRTNIREEQPGDEAGIRRVNLAAFETNTEADLVDALRRDATPIISLVAEEEEIIVGHILFSPATLVADPKLSLMGLAPMAVIPPRQRAGIGSRLVVEGIERCTRAHVKAVVVLGHAQYYPRFGFVPASELSLGCEYDVPANAFLVRELHEGALKGFSGTIRYHPIFAKF